MPIPTSPFIGDMGASLGLAPILTQLVTWAKQSRRPIWDIVLINIQTMVRNNQQKGVSIDQLIVKISQDIQLLQSYVVNYLQLEPRSAIDPQIIYYIPKYVIPEQYAKTINKSLQEQEEIVRLLKKKWAEHTTTQDGIITRCAHCGNDRTLPHRELLTKLQTWDRRYRYKRIALLSHIYLDFHLAQQVLQLQVIESFTAKVKAKTDLGPKIFKYTDFPLNSYLHILLGDGQYIKRSVDRKSIKLMQDKATRKKWPYQAEKSILFDLVHLGIIPKNYRLFITL